MVTISLTPWSRLWYNDNEACVSWTHNMTTRQIRHMEMRENSVREWVNDQLLRALHVKCKINPADTFTKEMRDGAHFQRLQDCFMCRLLDFLLVDVHLSHQQDEPVLHQIMPSAASSSFSVIQGSYLSTL